MSLTRRLSDKPQVPPGLLIVAIALGVFVTACPLTASADSELKKALGDPAAQSKVLDAG